MQYIFCCFVCLFVYCFVCLFIKASGKGLECVLRKSTINDNQKLTHLVTQGKKMASITKEAKFFDGNTLIDPFHQETQFLSKRLCLLMHSTAMIIICKLLVVLGCLSDLRQEEEEENFLLFIEQFVCTLAVQLKKSVCVGLHGCMHLQQKS